MTSNKDGSLALWQWSAIFGAAASTVGLTKVLRISPRWEHASVYTVILFATLIVVLRPAWGQAAFWRRLVILFAVHVLIISSLTLFLPAQNDVIRGIPAILACMAEGGLILRMMRDVVMTALGKKAVPRFSAHDRTER